MTDMKVAATLTASLLAPKGEARPAGWRAIAARTTEQRPWYAALGRDRGDTGVDDGSNGNRAAAPRSETASVRPMPLIALEDKNAGAQAGDATPGAGEAAQAKDTAPPAAASLARIGGDRAPAPAATAPSPLANLNLSADSRIRITARLERDLHRRLKLASAHLGTSSQDLIADALSHYLDGVAAGPMRGHCACLSKGGSVGACGGCGSEEASS
jgi:hypothetical protein